MKKIIYSVGLLLTLLLSLSYTPAVAQNIGSLKSVVPAGFSFTMDLSPGYTDSQVLQLQKVLNADVDTTVALDGEGSRGKETKYFGEATKKAVIKFQEKYRDTILTPAGLTSGTGIVGKSTRTKLNLLIGVMNTYDSVGSPESKGNTSSISNTATVYTPAVSTSVVQSSSPSLSTCQFIDLLISIQVILPSQANQARSIFGCSSSIGINTDLVPSVDIKVNNQSSTLTINSPKNVTVSWTSKNVTSCVSQTGSRPLSGSQSVYVSSSGTFVISCTGPYGTVTDSVAVKLVSSSTNSTSSSQATSSSASSVNLDAVCLANQTSANSVTWSAVVLSGGNGSYTYVWSGTDNLSGSAPYVSKTYSTSGTKTATVTVRSGSSTKVTSCNNVSVNLSTTAGNTNTPSSNPLNDYVLPSSSILTGSSLTSLIKGPTDVSKLIGYGVVNDWMNIDSASLSIQLASNGLTATDVEFLGFNDDGYYDNPSVLYPKFKTFVTNMRTQNITTVVNIVNWNKGAGNTSTNGGPSICDSRYDDAWFNGILDFFINQVGTDRIILQAASEWSSDSSSGGRNSQCFDKAQRWENALASKWTGMKSTNKGTRPTSAPSGWFFEYHPCSTSDLGANGSNVTTDCTGILTAINKNGDAKGLADTKNLKSYACRVKNSGSKGFLYYGFYHKQIDSDAIAALGQVAMNPSANCTDISEEPLPEEGGAGPDRFFQFGGYVVSTSQCNNSGSTKLWQVAIAPCKAGDAVSMQETTGASTFTGGYIVIRDGYQPVPTVGQTVLGRAVDDQGLKCSNGTGGKYIGTVTGALGKGGSCSVADPAAAVASGAAGTPPSMWSTFFNSTVDTAIDLQTTVTTGGLNVVKDVVEDVFGW